MRIKQKNTRPGLANLGILDMNVGRDIRALSFTSAKPFVRHTILAAGETPRLFDIGKQRMDSIREAQRLS
jgi:hypothetical protein